MDSPRDHKESDTTGRLSLSLSLTLLDFVGHEQRALGMGLVHMERTYCTGLLASLHTLGVQGSSSMASVPFAEESVDIYQTGN